MQICVKNKCRHDNLIRITILLIILAIISAGIFTEAEKNMQRNEKSTSEECKVSEWKNNNKYN